MQLMTVIRILTQFTESFVFYSIEFKNILCRMYNIIQSKSCFLVLLISQPRWQKTPISTVLENGCHISYICHGQKWELVKIESNTHFWPDYSGQKWNFELSLLTRTYILCGYKNTLDIRTIIWKGFSYGHT